MNNNTYNEMDDELRPKYDLSKLKGGVRGKYGSKCKDSTKLLADITDKFSNINEPDLDIRKIFDKRKQSDERDLEFD
jgi:hypothetical protein